MADFSALKTAIQANIRTNANEEITGAILQEILLSMVTTMGDGAINGLVTALQEEVVARQNAVGGEATARQDADSTLSGRINGEATAREEADTLLQNAINGITTRLNEGYVYVGIATPSTDPSTPAGHVFYIAMQGGTYTNFSGLTVTQGINILKYNGSAWSLEQLWGIDDVPTAGSNNLVKSGGVFANIGAFDISEYHKSGSTLATYADLTAALAALPSDFQKGGMSIKFVQSSDNKYVQYRYMGTATTGSPNPFLNTANWQGVDDEPTNGSDNLVTSGGVEKYMTQPSVFIISGDGDHLFDYVTRTGMSYLIFNNTNGCVTIANVSDSGEYYWTMADQLSPNQTVVFTYPQSSALSLPKIKVKTGTGFTGGEIKIVQTQSAFSSLLLQQSVIKRVNSLSFDVAFKSGGIRTSGPDIGQVFDSDIRCYCILDTVIKGNWLAYNIKNGYKLAICEWDGVSNEMNASWHTELNGIYNISETYLHVIVSKIDDSDITVDEATSAISLFYSDTLSPFVMYTQNKLFDLKYPYVWNQGTNGTTPGTISSYSKRCIAIINDIPSLINYKVNSDYSIIISEWNDGDTEFYRPLSWFNGTGFYKATKKNISIVVKKNDETDITPSIISKDLVDITISSEYNTVFESIVKSSDEIKKHDNFVQGTVQNSGTNIGQIIDSNIRCIDVLNLPIGTAISVIANSGYKAALTCYSDGDTNTTSTGFREGIISFRTFGTHAYLIVGKTNDSTIIPSEAIANVDACSSLKGNPILVSINKLEEKEHNKIPYIGEALPFNKTMKIKEYKTIPNWVNSQAGTVYGDFLVVALAMDEVAAGNPNGHLYNIKTREHISNLSFGNTLGGKTYTMPHGNQICFGKKYYNENSVFPLLYVSQTTLYEDEARKGELGVLVYDIRKVSDTEYTPVLVQAIIPDLSNQEFRDKISKWTTNYVVDTDNDKLYLVGYPRMWDQSDIYNSVKGYYPISKFALPKVSDGEEIVLTNSMLEDNYQIYRETAVQMILYYRGKMYIQGGFNGANAPKYLDSVDLCSHSIVSQINLSSVRTLEPQGLFVYDNRLLWYDAGTSGKIDEFIF